MLTPRGGMSYCIFPESPERNYPPTTTWPGWTQTQLSLEQRRPTLWLPGPHGKGKNCLGPHTKCSNTDDS